VAVLPPGNCPLTTSEDCLYLNLWAPDDASSEGGWVLTRPGRVAWSYMVS
jgi:hypothetical protein